MVAEDSAEGYAQQASALHGALGLRARMVDGGVDNIAQLLHALALVSRAELPTTKAVFTWGWKRFQ